MRYSRYLKSVVISLCGVTLTLLITKFTYNTEKTNIIRDLESHNEVLLDIIASKFRFDVNNTFLPNAIEAISLTQPFPNRYMFSNLTIPFSTKDNSKMAQLCVKVVPEGRSEFLSEMSLQYPELENLNVRDFDDSGNQFVSPSEDTVWATMHIHPDNVTRPIGLNFYSIIGEFVDIMVEKKRPVVSDIVVLPALRPEPRDRTFILVLLPVFIGGEIYGFILDFVRIGTLIREEVVVSSPEAGFKVSSLMIFKKNLLGEYDTLFDFADDPELDEFVIQGRALEFAKSRGKYCVVTEANIDGEYYSVLCTDKSVSSKHVWIPCLIGLLFIVFISLVFYFLDRNAILEKKIVSTREIEINRKSEFLSEMTHELRTPLNGIMGMCELVGYSSDIAETSEFIYHIKNGGKVLRNLIDNILEFSKVESGKLNFRASSEDIRKSLETTCSLVAASYIKPVSNIEPVKLFLEVDENIANDVYIDHARLNQVVTNMVSNASKFTDKGDITVSIYSKPVRMTYVTPVYMRESPIEYSDKSILHVDVCDSGIGMSPDKMEKLFEAFSQVHTDRSIGGSGLGLVVCQKICHDMGGTITCESTDGEGTKFSTSFVSMSGVISEDTPPYRRTWVLEDTRELYKTPVPKVIMAPVPDIHLSVLVVDDFNMNVKLLLKIMEKNNTSAMSCVNGRQAVDLSLKHKFDIIFIDFNMPVMNGPTATRLIRGNPENPNKDTNIVFLTGSDTEYTNIEATDSGASCIIAKPVSVGGIADIINTHRKSCS